MAEILTLTSPQSVSNYTISSILFDWSRDRIVVIVGDGFGKTLELIYGGSVAHTLMVALNKANMSTTSFQKRVFQQLVADGKLPAGSVTGSPE